MPPAQTSNKTTLSLTYTTLLSLLTALLTLKFYHAIASLTHGRKPRPATLHDMEQRIVAHFLRIVPDAAYRLSLGIGAGDGATDTDTDMNTNTELHLHRDNIFARLHSPRVPGIYHPRRETGTTTGTGLTGTNSNTNSNSYPNASPMFHFSAFDLPSNQPQVQLQAQTKTKTHAQEPGTDDSSFLHSLAMCAPYQRAGLRLPPPGRGPARYTVSSNETLPGRDMDSLVFGCASVSVTGAPTSTSTSTPTPTSTSMPTPKMTPSDDLRIVNAFPVRNGNGHGPDPDPDPNAETDTNLDSDLDLEAYLHEPVRLANSFPGDCPVTFGTGYGDWYGDGDGTGAGVEGLARSGTRGKPVISVRPFTDLD